MNLTTSPIRVAALLLALASTVACSKKDDTATPTPAPSSGWKVNGNTVAATFRVNNLDPTRIAVIGEFGPTTTGSRVTMILPRRTGTFAVGSTDGSIDYSEGSKGYSTLPNSGSIVVSSYSANNIAGTFNFSARGTSAADTTTKVVSGGAFNVNF